MKRHQIKLLLYAVLPALLLSTSGCFKDSCKHTYTLQIPVYKTLSQVRQDMKGGPATDIKNTGKLCISGNYIFLNEVGKGIHVIDNSNPLQPKNLSFINIPGNVDLAYYDQTLFADSYKDLVAFDVADAKNPKAVKFLDNAFPQNYSVYIGNSTNPDSIRVIASYINKDTTVDCGTNLYTLAPGCAACQYAVNPVASGSTKSGVNGSTSRFAIVNTNLYTVSSSNLNIFNIADPRNATFSNSKLAGSWTIETIFPFKDKLFLGTSSGMMIFDVSAAPTNPTLSGQFSHVTACDPVIADDNHAYVTLRNGTACHGNINEMDVLDISSFYSPKLVSTIQMNNPRGLSKDGNLLFVCDGSAGLKIYDATDAINPKLLSTVKGLEPNDVVAQNKKAIVIASDGLYQFEYSDPKNPQILSKFSIKK